MQDPRYVFWKVVNLITEYLQGTCDYWLQFTRMRKDDEMIFTSYYESN